MGVGSGVLFTIMCVCTQKISGVRKFCDFSYVLFTIDSYEFSYGRAAHDDRIMGVVIVGVFVYFRSKTACWLICRDNVKIRKFDHLIACNDYFAQLKLLLDVGWYTFLQHSV